MLRVIAMKRSCDNDSVCATFQTAMDVLARPWCGLILAVLGERGSMRFTSIGESIPQIGDRMLSGRLKELEELALVKRRVIPGPPVRVEYELTEAGRGFGDVQCAIGKWGELIAKSQAREKAKEKREPSKARKPQKAHA
jgi:DNA-binding HxlR family transcriptional regulator